ncbi:CCA tRNA nucleotidyltransferase [Paenibacillus thalictri]|uniref:CCA tRNA nucleotidyltransferase n=1 Tax=Paenibacillus thalictri TaxID=2527873 RepID=A0A4Q9DWV3_9BACL|nr:CCA tRNA nucleotidyltransferase [Paenibacillus thalictri]TBL79711.1 CCA tRNA nucleotidyltransferase [Paenibacillus thalictri]
MQTELIKGAQQVVRTLQQSGFAAYMVGGYVRDTVLGKPIKDIDIATSALPEQVQALFTRTVPTGLQHGTVTVMLGKTPYEVTTFRKESDYVQYRRPAEVEFVDDLLEDLKRRDFTMNAMAMDADGRLVDPFGGQTDIAQRTLRCVGLPHERFREDALRMLRCVRFAAEYELHIDAATWQALLELAPLLRHIAMERVRAELERMVEGGHPNRGLQLLADSGIVTQLKMPLHLPLSKQAVARMKELTRLDADLCRWTYVFMAAGSDHSLVREDMLTLTFPKQKAEQVAKRVEADRYLLDGLAVLPAADRERAALLAPLWKKAALRYTGEALRDLIRVYELDAEAGAQPEPYTAACRRVFASYGEAWLSEMPAADVNGLRITGTELVAHIGQRPGPWVGKLLQRLLEQTALESLPNEKQPLLAAASSLYEEMMNNS